MRVAAQHRDVDVERAQQLGRHQTEQVGPGRLAETGHLRERPLGAGRPAQHARGLEHDDVEPGPGQKDRGDETVVTGADDHDVGLGGDGGHDVRA
jgi:hypothetical protein